MRYPFVILFLLFSGGRALAQADTRGLIENLNQSIDLAVVHRDFEKLRASYADDFVFTHGTGTVDSRESWLLTLQQSKDKFISRQHDSTQVELHGDVAILTGRLLVSKEKGSMYGLNYIRVYALRNGSWMLLSHRTLKEWHY